MGISTHILDTGTGRPAAGVPITLTTLTETIHAQTDPDGRHRFFPEPPTPGLCILRFNTAAYYAAQGIEGLYPYVEIAFVVAPGHAHYHIPLLLAANGYTTYRGS
jgi:5-hydroxyisourate hydrolase